MTSTIILPHRASTICLNAFPAPCSSRTYRSWSTWARKGPCHPCRKRHRPPDGPFQAVFRVGGDVRAKLGGDPRPGLPYKHEAFKAVARADDGGVAPALVLTARDQDDISVHALQGPSRGIDVGCLRVVVEPDAPDLSHELHPVGEPLEIRPASFRSSPVDAVQVGSEEGAKQVLRIVDADERRDIAPVREGRRRAVLTRSVPPSRKAPSSSLAREEK